jgi:hypothetical protein
MDRTDWELGGSRDGGSGIGMRIGNGMDGRIAEVT